MKEFNEQSFRVKFRAFFAVLGFLSAMAFVFVAVLSKEAQVSKYTGTILGFMTGTLVTLVFTYYFGSSEAPGSDPVKPIEPSKLPEKRSVKGTGAGGLKPKNMEES